MTPANPIDWAERLARIEKLYETGGPVNDHRALKELPDLIAEFRRVVAERDLLRELAEAVDYQGGDPSQQVVELLERWRAIDTLADQAGGEDNRG